MPTVTQECYSQEQVLEAFEDANLFGEAEEISYEAHIERMDRIRDERRDRVYPAPPRDPRVDIPNEERVTATEVGAF